MNFVNNSVIVMCDTVKTSINAFMTAFSINSGLLNNYNLITYIQTSVNVIRLQAFSNNYYNKVKAIFLSVTW